jgi:hypothetical protein
MIKEAIQYLIDLGIAPDERFVDIQDAQGADRTFIIDEKGAAREIEPLVLHAEDALKINTLTGLVAYIQSKVERSADPLFLQVLDEKTVYLKSSLAVDGSRETLVIASAIVPRFAYDTFLSIEELNISLQAKFVASDDSRVMLKVIGNIKEENVKETGDNGISQAVTIKTGIASMDDVKVPNPVALAPYRTFLEVEQPTSNFIFRMKDGPKGAIFEADGGAWRNEAIENVSKFLAAALTEEIVRGHITIIA